MWQFEDARSPEVKAKDERKREERRKLDAEREAIIADDRAKPLGWRPIEAMPFEAYGNSYGEQATVLLTDGGSIAVASVSDRFGRPIKIIEEPKQVLTDQGVVMMGGKYEEYDWPQWMFDWEFRDQLSHESEKWGKDEIGFIPTHYMPLPLPPGTKAESENQPQNGENYEGDRD